MSPSCSFNDDCHDSPVIGFEYCPDHLSSPRGIFHAQERIREGPMFTVADLEAEIARRTDIPENDYHTSALEKMDAVLTEILEWNEDAKTNLYAIPRDEWRYRDRTQSEQTRMEVGLYERSQDRAARVLKDVSKMALSEKIVSIGRAQTELIIRIMMGTLEDLGLDVHMFDKGRKILLRRFQDEGNLSSRVEEKVTKELDVVEAEVM
jgi:hypothetical protein